MLSISTSGYKGQIADKPEASIFKRYGKPAKETRGVNTCDPHDPTVLQRIAKMVDTLIYDSKSAKLSVDRFRYRRSSYQNWSSEANFTTPETLENQGVSRHVTQFPDTCQSVGLNYQCWPSCSLREVDEGEVLPPNKCPGIVGDLQIAEECAFTNRGRVCIISQRDEPGCLWGQHNQSIVRVFEIFRAPRHAACAVNVL